MSLHRSQHEEFENQPDEFGARRNDFASPKKITQKNNFLLDFTDLSNCTRNWWACATRTLLKCRKAADSVYAPNSVKKQRDVERLLKEGKPISILLMGTDTGALGRSFKGRT